MASNKKKNKKFWALKEKLKLYVK